jgi:hypothetical protein
MEREIMRILLANAARRPRRRLEIAAPSNVVLLAHIRERRLREQLEAQVRRCLQCGGIVSAERRARRKEERYCSLRCDTDAYRGVPPQSDT